MEDIDKKGVYEFGAFRLDEQNRLLWCAGQVVALPLKEFEVLLWLVSHAGLVVEKDSLLEALWKDVYIEEATLTRHISRLRKNLTAAHPDGAKLIETLPKRGYRFHSAVVKTYAEPLLIIEEQTVQHIRIEETIVTPDSIGTPEIDAAPALLAHAVPALAAPLSPALLAQNVPALPAHLNTVAPVALLPAATAPRRQFPAWLVFALGTLATLALAFTLYQNLLRPTPAKVILASRVRLFSGLPGQETMPAFSPDSKQIAFVWNGGDPANFKDVYVKLSSTGEPVRLTHGPRDALGPVFSPDGQQVAFYRSAPEATKIYAIPALGGAERVICEVHSGGTTFAWSPDGKNLAVADNEAETGVAGLILVDVTTGTKQRITTAPNNYRDHSPRFSPDGKTLAFTRVVADNDQDVYTVAAQPAAEPRRLTFDHSRISGTTWSADGQHIVFSSRREQSAAANLWQIPARGGTPVLISVNAKEPVLPALAPDGQTLAYVESFEDSNIWRLPLNGPASSPQPATHHPQAVIASPRTDHSQQLSPDNQKIVFISERNGVSGLWLANADGSNPLLLAPDGGSPRFSPDGKLIAFGFRQEGRETIRIISVEGGPSRPLTNGAADDYLPAWSTDGTTIYFVSNRGGAVNLWKMPASGGDAVQITQQGAFESFAAPDGKTIYYSKERGVVGLWRVNVDGSDESPVPELADAGFYRSWTLTPQGLYYVAQAPRPPFAVKFYDFATRTVREVGTVKTQPLWVFSGLSASSDGQTILYAQQDQNASSIMLADLAK